MLPRDGLWNTTHTGKRIYIRDPREHDFCIEDIAHGLANICRYGGQCISFYSVAEHCIRGAAHAHNPTLALEFLLHDAAEAYVGDAVRPLAQCIPDYCEIRDNMQWTINRKFGFPASMSKECEVIDERMLSTEARIMFVHADKWWESPGFAEPYENEFVLLKDRPRLDDSRGHHETARALDRSFMPPRQAKRLFLEKFNELIRGVM